MDATNIGKFIKEKRKQKNLTQSDIATALNISPQAVSKWERFESLPDISSLPILADILGVNVEDIINSAITTNEDTFEETMDILNAFLNKEVFEKLLSKLESTNKICEANISLNIFAFLNTCQKDNLLDALLIKEDYSEIIDDIIPYLNNAQRRKIIRKILDDSDYEYLERMTPFISKTTKTEIVIALLYKREFEPLEEIIPFLNKEQKEIIINYVSDNKLDLEILENFVPFFDIKQRKMITELLKKRRN